MRSLLLMARRSKRYNLRGEISQIQIAGDRAAKSAFARASTGNRRATLLRRIQSRRRAPCRRPWGANCRHCARGGCDRARLSQGGTADLRWRGNQRPAGARSTRRNVRQPSAFRRRKCRPYCGRTARADSRRRRRGRFAARRRETLPRKSVATETWWSASPPAARRLTCWARLRECEAPRATTIGITANRRSPHRAARGYHIAPETGPEVIAGSTRMKAGTAQKLVLNMLSTAAMIRLGRVYDNWMVDVALTNEKLRRAACAFSKRPAGASVAAQHALRRRDTICAWRW